MPTPEPTGTDGVPAVTAPPHASWSEHAWRLVIPAFECLGLIYLACAIGVNQVAAHWTSIWMDREFTGWIAPVANRMASGQTLYTDGGHIPMPPLSFIVMRWIWNGEATWYDESLCIFVSQTLLILTMYIALCRSLPQPVPFLAAFASMPLIYALPKTIFYDGLAQLFVALGALWVALAVEDEPPGWGLRLVMAATGALAVLSKQSTGSGLVLGTVAGLVLAGGRRRWTEAPIYLVLTGLTFGIFVLLLQPYLSIEGLIRDVFLTGSEPKGGARRLLTSTGLFLQEISFPIYSVLLGVAPFLASGRAFRHDSEIPGWPSPGRRVLLAVVGVGTFLAYWFTQVALELVLPIHLEQLMYITTWMALLIFPVRIVTSLAGAPTDPCLPRPMLAMFYALFSAAFFHCFSVTNFRWTYDNNPLLVLALGAYFGKMLQLQTRGFKLRSFALAITALAVMSVWSSYKAQVRNWWECTEEWPEIQHLRGAKMRPECSGMRQLVKTVRQLAPSPTASVLLLPGDPNVEAWLGRQRPKLSCAIPFADQYWDHYVDDDFKRLVAAPPRVIIIGPRHYWRPFHQIWRANWGCERLIDLVMERLIPQHYRLVSNQEIGFQGTSDVMDVYVRSD